MLTFMRTKMSLEAHAFTVKYDNIRIERSEIRASDASRKARTARLEKKTLEKVFFGVKECPMYETGIAD
ncbi:hypothetical protein TNCV_1187861 [Trichonephila clavipes]|nr:hypothetical protein TNCV_1187861 [Trichonephila clavipes]